MGSSVELLGMFYSSCKLLLSWSDVTEIWEEVPLCGVPVLRQHASHTQHLKIR